MKHPPLLIALILCLAGPATAAEATTQSTSQPAGDEWIQLNLPESVEIKVLVDYVAQSLGMNVLYDASTVSKRITIIAPSRIRKDSLRGFLENVLKISGLALAETDQAGWEQIVPNKNLLTLAKIFASDKAALATASATTPLSVVFEPKHVKIETIEKHIKPFMSTPGGYSLSMADRGLIVITDYSVNLRRVAALIDMLDKPGRTSQIRFVPVKHRDAADLATQVTELLDKKDSVLGGDAKSKRALVLTTEPMANQIVMIYVDGAETEALELIKMLDIATEAISKTYRFEHIRPERIDKLAREFIGVQKGRTAYKSVIDTESGMLIVEAPARIHARIEELRKALDIAPDTVTRTYRFEYISPQRVERLARDMEDLATGRAYKSVTDVESGLLIVTGPVGVHERIAELKKQLDVADIQKEFSNIGFYKLMNTTASEVLATIRSMESGDRGLTDLAKRLESGDLDITGEGTVGPNRPSLGPRRELPKPPAFKDDAPTTQPAGEGAQAVPASRSVTTDNAVVTADPNTNTVIIVAPPAMQRLYKQLISVLDKRRPQVMIEVTMITLDTSDNFSLGVEISGGGEITGGGSEPGDRYMVFSSFGLSEVDGATGRLALTPGVGFNGAVISANIADVVIRALAADGHTKVLSSPRMLVNDNASATLSSVSEAPFTSVNASTTVSTTSFAGYAQAGTTLSITPHISEGEHIQLQYSITLNSFTGDGGGDVPPPRQTNTLDSQVTIPDGHAIIVGGLTRKDFAYSATRLPYIGKIPLLGELISSTTRNESQSTLFVFIRPVILRDDKFADLKFISQRDLTRAELPGHYPSSEPLIME